MALLNARITLDRNSHTCLIFENNHASDVGGAVYVVINPFCSVLHEECFYWIPITSLHSKINVHLEFANNTAGRGGNDVYGAAPNDYCIDYIKIPTKILYPGERFTLPVVVVGYEFGTLASIVYSSILVGNQSNTFCTEPTDVCLGPGQAVQLIEFQQCNHLEFSLHSANATNGMIIMKVNQTTTNQVVKDHDLHDSIWSYHEFGVILSLLLSTPLFINFTLLDCPTGFTISENPPTCNNFLRQFSVSNCSIESHIGIIDRYSPQWIGLSNQRNKTVIISTPYCPSGYCQRGTISLKLQ